MTDTIREPLLCIDGLSKSFAENGSRTARKTLFRDLSLTIDTNQIVGILGHSGSGKSTLLNLIAGLDTPDAGEIRVDGRRVTRPGSDRMVIFQHYALLPWLTVADNVRLAVDETMRDRPAAEREGVVQKYVNLVNLGPAVHKRPHELSGGMRQRVGIARALAVRPLLLLMDEPFGALDPFTRGMLQDQVLNLFYQEHQTIVLITHDVDEALTMCDRIILLQAGEPATISRDLDVHFPHPRDRATLRRDEAFHALRNEIMGELERSFVVS